MATPRFLVAFASATAIAVLAFIVAVAVGEWWILPVALGAHALGFLVVMRMVASRAGDQRNKPDPVTEAQIEEEEAVERSGPNGSRRPEDEPRVFGH